MLVLLVPRCVRTLPNARKNKNAPHGLFIRTDLMQRNVLDSNTNSFGNILARVPIKVQSGGVIFH